MNFIINFIKSTYVEIENVPQPYGVFHLTFIFLSLLIMVTICYLSRKSSDKTFRIVMFCTGLFLILSEIYKQLYYYYAAGGEGYDWYIFPFQLCSVPMYLSVIVGCMKKNKIRDSICGYLASIGFLGGIMAYVEPSGILNGQYFTLIHSCVWHALLIFIALYILFTNNACKNLGDYKYALIIFGGVVLAATALNLIFRDKPNFNMLYISPFHNSPLAVFSSFDTFFEGILGQYPGRIVSILIYIFAVASGGFIIYAADCFVNKKLRSGIPARIKKA
ncbi:MAG: YwaF family protein [Clostridia bacterium]|nr:YwaF family protein [Clostridia bacterium]